jgi:hypothetical protein
MLERALIEIRPKSKDERVFRIGIGIVTLAAPHEGFSGVDF